jgi:hypothetical protein
VAEVDEEETEAVNARLKALGAAILRRDLSDLADREYEHEMGSIKRSLADATRTLADRRARLQAKTDRGSHFGLLPRTPCERTRVRRLQLG